MDSITVNSFTIRSLTDIKRFLLSNTLFQSLPDNILDRLAHMARLRKVANRTLIHAKGDDPDGMYAVVSGCVRATSSMPDGREALLALLEPGSWFGESSLFDEQPRAYDTHAQGDCELILIPRDEIGHLLEEHPEIYRHIVKLLCQRIRLSLALLESNALLSIEGRLAKRLLMLIFNAQDDRPQQPRLTLQLSQDDLSQMLGVSRQSINKILKTWEQHGLLQRHYRSLTITDIKALQAINMTCQSSHQPV